MCRIAKIIAVVSMPMLVGSCGSFTKPCEQEDFAKMLLQTSLLEGGVKEREITGAKFQDIIELKREEKTAICSGELIGTQKVIQYPISQDEREGKYAKEFTWKVEETQDGENFFTWVVGRKSASDLE